MLLLHRHLAASDVIAGITAALTVGSVSPDVVAVEARKAAHQCGAHARIASPNTTPAGDRVVSLTERRLAELPADSPPVPSVSQHDELLTGESSRPRTHPQ